MLQFLINIIFIISVVKFSDQKNVFMCSTSKVRVPVAHSAEAAA